VDETRFRAMGSDVHVAVSGGTPRILEEARRRIAVLESRWSRFVPGSEVSRLARAGGFPVEVSADTRLLVSLAVEAWHRTAGAFDPTVLGAVVRAGYDRTFDDVAAGADALAVTSRGAVRGTPGLGRFLGGRALPDHVGGSPAAVAAGAAEAGR